MTIEESYKVLKLKPDATENDVRSAYKQLIKKYHPDTFRGNKKIATEKTMQINQAYRILTFKEKPTGPSRREMKPKKKFFLFRLFDDLKKKRKLKKKQKQEKMQAKENRQQEKKIKKEKQLELKNNIVAPEILIIGIMAIILVWLVVWFLAAGK